MNAYLFVFNRNTSVDYNKLHENIKSDRHISNWWHYLNSAYILISSYDANQLADSIRSYYPYQLLVIKITKSNYQGWLPQDAWDWISKNVPYQ
ncbi:hypothetical protein A2697_04425 [Candidatus Curtissbacteria bacterium RIFCSPHIGHO2_01_FULL_41_44]|nr:MAG: hypothetical protein A2697_04425 [Candidatus Curtissbacteria bacterium RIFCSPHIGHO2_01_FULL_41_44]OGE02942.1 MAG: hypothetical protein A3G16_04395 [Candidatus Curtissbacteria bacterium RIFCSPLOWO2_12_FULL_41_16]OGE10715.1 MAG: hypothetical protein A3H87_03385 [Candidatus Curtissbacteria bacterium RIFCSPLOWO2_02_FULL_42_37]